MTNQNDTAQPGLQDLAHELWAAAQTPPGESVEDAVARISELLSKRYAGGAQAGEPFDAEVLAERLRDVAASHYETAMAFGISRDNFERCATDAAKLMQDMASTPAAGGADKDGAQAEEHYDEVKSALQGAHRIMEGIASIERRVGPVGSHARGYTHKITNALRHLDMLYAAPEASVSVRNEALYLLREARALLPTFATAEAVGAWAEKVNQFASGRVIDIPPESDQTPIKLSDGALKFLRYGVADVTRCEEADVDQDLADELLQLIHGPIYKSPPAPSVHVAEGLVPDLRPHLEWALQRISVSLDVGEKYEAALAALDSANENAPKAGEVMAVQVYVFSEGNRYLAHALLPKDTPLRPGLNTLYAAHQRDNSLKVLEKVRALISPVKTDKDTVLGAKALRDLKAAEAKLAEAIAACPKPES